MLTTAFVDRFHECMTSTQRIQDGLQFHLRELIPPEDGNGDCHALAVAQGRQVLSAPVSGAVVGAPLRRAGTGRVLRLSATFGAPATAEFVTHVLVTDESDAAIASFFLDELYEGSDADGWLSYQEGDAEKEVGAGELWKVNWELFHTPAGAAAAIPAAHAVANTALAPDSWSLSAAPVSGQTTPMDAWAPSASMGSVETASVAGGATKRTRATVALDASPAGTWTVTVRESADAPAVITSQARSWPAGAKYGIDVSTPARTLNTPVWAPPAPNVSVARGQAFSGRLPAVPGASGAATYQPRTGNPSWLTINSDGTFSGTAPQAAGTYSYGWLVSAPGLSGTADITDPLDPRTGNQIVVA